ncbi:MAG TPA: hypothetical protein VMR70_20665 [Flavisolibacter sp.]|nr:hypothetical protein [Flavisolibacter sp.]
MWFWTNYYYIILALQGICVLHCMRKRNEQKWIYLIIFLPVIGCIAYFFTEIVNERGVSNITQGIGNAVNPSNSIKKLEKRLKFADTHQNKVLLADAYLAAGNADTAIQLYEESRVGVFVDNEYVLMQMVKAYAAKKEYAKVLQLAVKVKDAVEFQKSKAHVEYAKALYYTGNTVAAEKQFAAMKGKFAHYEPRYYYGLFLADTGRREEAVALFNEMLEEQKHLGSRERAAARQWVNLVKGSLGSIKGVV